MSITVDKNICTQCEACADSCPFGAIDIVDGFPEINEKCNLCGACEDACPVGAIEIKKKVAKAAEGYNGVWVFAEQRKGDLAPVSFELLGEGRRLAENLGVELSAVLFGFEVKEKVSELYEYGADNVFLADEKSLGDFNDDLYGELLIQMINEHKPEVVLCGATALGRSFLPKVANALNTGLTADCTGLDVRPEDRLLLQTRPAFGGNIMATILCPYRRPQMATVRPRVMKALKRERGRVGKLVEIKIDGRNIDRKTRVLESVTELTDSVNLGEAEIIVAGGRGMGSKNGFELIKKLADLLGGVVGASRGAVDSEWIGCQHQVGQTGKTVAPKVYIACGVSGAVQHLVGMQSSDVIIAINKDPNAPIFDVADYAIVGDASKVLPELIKRLETMEN